MIDKYVCIREFFFIGFILAGGLSACSFFEDAEPTVDGRWYTESQVKKGSVLFANNCAACHGKYAQGNVNWRKKLANGKYPPPPLNGKGHAWHHPMSALRRTIRKGSIAMGGSMPSFANTLSNEEIEAVISFVQSKWSPEVYQAWSKRK